jgi:hypothetical protein
MKPRTRTYILSTLALLVCVAGHVVASPMGSAFSYQGQLNDGTNPANGSYDLQFAVFDASTSGTQLGSTLTSSATAVSNGLFTVTLDFGATVFTGAARWLAISVRTNGSGSFVLLSPRQPLLPAPYAIMANSSSNLLGTVSATSLSGVVPLAQLPTVVLTNNETGVTLSGTFSGTFSGNGAGLVNVPSTPKWQAVTAASQQAQPNTGYVANSATRVTITLPTSPAVGDTVRVSGAGAGGWKIAQNAGQSILGANLGLVGANWAAHAPTLNWHCLASSTDGTKLVAGADGGPIYTSTDSGVTWTSRTGNAQWYGAASSSDGTKLVAVVNNGQIYTSNNSGANWNPRDSNRQWYSVASSSDGTKLVAVVLNGRIYTSTDSGLGWTARDSSRQWCSVASSSDGTRLAAVVSGGQIYTSTDSGATWVPRGSSQYWSSVASSSDGTKLVAAVGPAVVTQTYLGQIYTSTDSGTNWTPQASAAKWTSIASSADGTKLIASVDGGQIYLSSDSGASWAPRGSVQSWNAVTSSTDGSKLVAGVYGGQIYTSSTASTTPGTAGYLLGGQNTAIELQFIGNGQFLPLSHEGAFAAY